MATVTRKRSTPPSITIKEEYNSEDEHSVDEQLQFKVMAKEFVNVNKKVLADEENELNIKEFLTGKFQAEKMFKNDDYVAVPTPTLPPFTIIHRTSTGHFICPLGECNQHSTCIKDLKIHYRIHGGSQFRPYRCSFPDDNCQYASAERKNVERHVRTKHFHLPASFRKTVRDDRDEAEYVETRTELLEMEDALFKSAEIISSSEGEKPRAFACTFANCTKRFTCFGHLRRHRQSHAQVKPFSCSFSNCGHSSTRREHILSHIHSVHFNVSHSMQRKLSKEEKQRAERYVDVKQEVLDEAEMSSIRVAQKPTVVQQNRLSTNFVADYDSTFYCQVQLDYSSEAEDDKDKICKLFSSSQN